VLCEFLSIHILTDILCSCLYRMVGPRRRLPGYRTTPQVLWLVSAVNMYVWYPVSESDHDLILPDAGLLQYARQPMYRSQERTSRGDRMVCAYLF